MAFESWDVFSFFSGLPPGSGEIDTLQNRKIRMKYDCPQRGKGSASLNYRCDTVFVSGIVAYSSSKWNIVFQHTGMSAVVGGMIFDDDER